MNNEVLNDIKDYATKRLMQEYDYCAVAEADDMAMLTCDDKQGNDIKINITVKPE